MGTFRSERSVVSLCVSVISTNFHFDLLVFNGVLLLIEAENDNTNVLNWQSIRDQLNSEFLILPVLRLKAIKDDTGVAVFFLHAHLDHLDYHFTWQEPVFSFVNLRDGITLLWLLRFHLSFESSNCFCAFLRAIFEVFSGLISDSMVAFGPVVEKLIEFDNAALVLLCHVVGDCRPARTTWSHQDQVQSVRLFDSWGELYLEVIRSDLLKLRLEITLLVGVLVSHCRDLLLSFLGLTRRL